MNIALTKTAHGERKRPCFSHNRVGGGREDAWDLPHVQYHPLGGVLLNAVYFFTCINKSILLQNMQPKRGLGLYHPSPVEKASWAVAPELQGSSQG